MPSSSIFGIQKSLEFIWNLQPKRVLDIGIGFGKWGFLCREYLDVYHGRVAKEQWQTTIHGVEVYREYHTPIYDFVYDKIFYGNILDLLDNLEQYDLIVLADVLEHFPKNTGHKLIKKLLTYCKFLLITTPNNWLENDFNDNEYEKHKSLWKAADFLHYRGLYIENFNKEIVFLSNSRKLTQISGRQIFFFKNRIFQKFPIIRHIINQFINYRLNRFIHNLPKE